jgi:lipopolysaccharide biosynthesis protein
MMDVQNLQARVDQVESKRAQLLKFQADPNLSSLSLDIDQALIEMDDLMAEFRQTFPTGIVEPVADN